tara:strand:+ start:1436 stop:1930 length:495 start_codon:yes stop_codon:yes gene_type:complete
MSGGKGGSSSTSVQIPAYIEDAAKSNLGLADKISNIGYTPYYGPDVAAFSPMQDAAFQNTQGAASAFGMNTGAGQYMPEATEFAGGVKGYSSAPTYEQSVENLAQFRPAQKQYMDTFFMNPQTGQAGSNAAPMGGAESYSPSSYTNSSPLGVQPISRSTMARGK